MEHKLTLGVVSCILHVRTDQKLFNYTLKALVIHHLRIIHRIDIAPKATTFFLLVSLLTYANQDSGTTSTTKAELHSSSHGTSDSSNHAASGILVIFFRVLVFIYALSEIIFMFQIRGNYIVQGKESNVKGIILAEFTTSNIYLE